jgi:hypothetical protein
MTFDKEFWEWALGTAFTIVAVVWGFMRWVYHGVAQKLKKIDQLDEKVKKLDESSVYKTMLAPPPPAPPPPEPPPVVPPAGGVDASIARFGLALLAVGLGLGVGLSRASDR